MAKKKNEPSNEPIISSIPVPPSDSALVIDLPDGQKLLVGKIETGTVIEVATWRGTGRPDSRTNRLMLGMSSESEAKQATEAANQPKQISSKDLKFPQNLIFIANQFSKKLKPFFKSILRNLIRFIRNFDIKSIKLTTIRSKIKLPDIGNFKLSKKSPGSLQIGSSKFDDDIDADFQRILDEVSQRREASSKKSPRKSGVDGAKSKKKSLISGKSKSRGSNKGR